jgi:hypothetical protein
MAELSRAKNQPAIAAAHADRQATLRWVIAASFDPDGRAAWALARLEGRPAGKEPPPRASIIFAVCASSDCTRRNTKLHRLRGDEGAHARHARSVATPTNKPRIPRRAGPMRGNRE